MPIDDWIRALRELPDEGFAMTWSVDSRAEKRLKEITQAVKRAGRLYLATDPDREGEAISWHIAEELKRRKALDGISLDVPPGTFTALLGVNGAGKSTLFNLITRLYDNVSGSIG